MDVPRIVGNHYLTKVLGEGRFGVVFYATNEQKDVFAAKCVSKSHIRTKSSSLRLEREISTLQQICSPHVAKLHSVSQTSHNIYIFMEYCAGPSLRTAIDRGNLQVHLVRCWLTNIVDACLALKANNVMHRDLKPENIMLTHTDLQLARAKLIDFGLAKHESDIEAKLEHTKVGSPRYVAPEILATGRYNCNVDVYSFGKLAEELSRATLWEEQEAAMREDLDKIVQSALTPDPFARPSFEQLRQMAFFLLLPVPIKLNEPRHLLLSNIPIDQSNCDGPTAIYSSIRKKYCADREIWTLGLTMKDKSQIYPAHWLFQVYAKRMIACGWETSWHLAKHNDSGLEALLRKIEKKVEKAKAAIKDAESLLKPSDFPHQSYAINNEAFVIVHLNMPKEALQLLTIAEEEYSDERGEVWAWRRSMIEYLEKWMTTPRISTAN